MPTCVSRFSRGIGPKVDSTPSSSNEGPRAQPRVSPKKNDHRRRELMTHMGLARNCRPGGFSTCFFLVQTPNVKRRADGQGPWGLDSWSLKSGRRLLLSFWLAPLFFSFWFVLPQFWGIFRSHPKRQDCGSYHFASTPALSLTLDGAVSLPIFGVPSTRHPLTC